MGLLRSALRTGLAGKAIQIARREASKPENQRKAKELFAKVSNRGTDGGHRSGGALPRQGRRRP